MLIKDDHLYNGKALLESFVTLFTKTMSQVEELPSITLKDILSQTINREEAEAAFEEKPRPWVSHSASAIRIKRELVAF